MRGHINKASRNLNSVRRNLNIVSSSKKKVAYMSLVRPTVEFASSVRDPYEMVDINRLEMIQRPGARFVKHLYQRRSSVTEIRQNM